MFNLFKRKRWEPEAQRAVIRLALDEIASEVGTASLGANLDFPVYLTVPNSGDSLATMAVPLIRWTQNGR